MPDWLPGVIIAVVAIIPTLWATVQQRRRVDAETDSAIAQSYKLLVDDLTKQIEEARQGCRVRDEELRNLKEENELLYEQKMALIGHNQVLTAHNASLRGEDLVNSLNSG